VTCSFERPICELYGFDDYGIDHDGVPDEYIDTRCYWHDMYDYMYDGIDNLVDVVIAPMKIASVTTTYGFDDYGIDPGIKALMMSMMIISMMLSQKIAS
jgi:hypothetical protein